MEIENLKATSRAKLWLIRMPLLLVLVVLVLTLMDIIPTAFWLILSAGLFVLTLMTVLIGRLQYVKFIINEKEITIRHYHLFPLITDYQELLIARSDNPKFELRHVFLGLIPVLQVIIQTSQGRAVYPSIPLSLVSKSDLKKLSEGLSL